MSMLSKFREWTGRFSNSGLAKPAQWLIEWAGGGKSVSGEAVNEKTALGLSVYIACIKNISEDIAKLPLGMFKRVPPRGREAMPNHPVHRLLHDEANEEMSAMSFRETITAHALGWSGGFAEIVRNGAGSPVALYPLDPTCVRVMRDDVDRRLFYSVDNIRLEARDVFHIHGLGYDGLTGYVLSRIAKNVVGNALAAQKFSGSYYANGTSTTGIIEVPDAMSEPAFKHLRESFHQRYGGSNNQHKPIILEEGAKYTPTSSAAKDSQMIEAMQHSIEEICRLFRMPPHKVQHLLRATFSNIEMQAIEYVVDCLLGWSVRWEQEVSRKLLFPQERGKIYAKHNFNMLLRGDSAAQSAYFREMSNIGVFGVNDVRELLDMDPVEGGDTHFINSALIPLHLAATGEHMPSQQPEPPPAEPAKPEPDEDDAPTNSLIEHKRELIGRVAAAHTKSLEDSIAAVLRVEHDKVLRASKRDDFKAWAGDFYGETHRNHVSERLKPSIQALCASLETIVWS